jgi:regulator of nonsense transcripts 3
VSSFTCTDEDYISFIESLKAAENVEPVSIETLSKCYYSIAHRGRSSMSSTVAASQPAPPPKTTPLLEALKAEKSAANDKEAILRNHAHYKEGDAAARKEEKKKATTSVPPPKVAQLPNLPSKKSKKLHAQEQSQVPDVQTSGIAVNSNKPTPRNVPTPASIPKTITQNPSSTSQSTRPPKPPKSRQAAPNKAPAASGSVAVSNMMMDASTSASANNQPIPAPVAPRRARPVIPSRQFEAALSIAGLATSASERRKREKEKVMPSSTVDDNNTTSPPLSKRQLQVMTANDPSAQASNILGSSVGLDTERDKSRARSCHLKRIGRKGVAALVVLDVPVCNHRTSRMLSIEAMGRGWERSSLNYVCFSHCSYS